MAGESSFPPATPAARLKAEGLQDVNRRVSKLSTAQMRVLLALAEAKLNKQIASDMEITEATVKAHMTAIFKKLAIANRTQAILLAEPLVVANLGWKLAATVNGWAPEGLLDTYFHKRHPEGVRVLDWSRAQVGLMRPSSSSRALTSIMRNLIDSQDGATYFAEKLWGVTLRYDLGSEHALVGPTMPDFELADGTRLGSWLKSGRGLLLDFDAHESVRAAAAHWADRITYVASDAKHRLGMSAVLVRPDDVVAWAVETVPSPKNFRTSPLAGLERQIRFRRSASSTSATRSSAIPNVS